MNTQVLDHVKSVVAPLVIMVDGWSEAPDYPISLLDKAIKELQNSIGPLGAMPFAGTQNKAEELEKLVELLRAAKQLHLARAAVRDFKPRFVTDEKILALMGF